MAMVGLFWITADAVYVGAPPGTEGRGVRLTGQGVEAVWADGADGADGARTWTWAELRAATVEGAPVRSASRRRLSLAVETVLTAALGGAGEPPQMILRLETPEGAEELSVHSAAAGAYVEEEFALSQDLLARFVDGTASPLTLAEWGRDGDGTTPKPPTRQTLLREWAGT
ncbi:hypothetical protein J7E88_22995 [Streptomyces sp. ISL-10]|uniref:hypothetical protein n=1 Tax=Streptomyces sp. ISL-10 TaxID=2819172 RepID=UPI001BE51CF3|nr:hypothetical protein [Streptomyces sp. ISL-10]MBT2368105.1 hypothetical protein [Streptomyces sp. ISL-10]